MEKKELELQTRLRNNDKKALEEVYLAHKNAFIQYGLQFGLDRETLLDLYQDSAIALFQNFVKKQLQLENSSIKTYLFGIGKHKIYTYLKQQNKFKQVAFSEDAVAEIELGTPELSKEEKLLQKYFNRLGESCQNILRMYYYRGLRIREIVSLTDYKDENTVKSHKSRCLKKLKALINNHQ